MENPALEKHPWARFIPHRLDVEWEFIGDAAIHPEIEGIRGRSVVFCITKTFNRFERLLAKVLRAPKQVRRTMHPTQSMLWELIDNQRNFLEICSIMERLYHEDIVPVGPRIQAYLEVFVRLNVVTVFKPQKEE
jgi:hypothetical protein